jgi:hypothetical protein
VNDIGYSAHIIVALTLALTSSVDPDQDATADRDDLPPKRLLNRRPVFMCKREKMA